MSDKAFTRRRMFLLRLLSTALVLAALTFIFSNSPQSGENSRNLSGMVTALINVVLSAMGLPPFTSASHLQAGATLT